MKKRDRDPYKNLNPALNLKSRREEIYIDYIDKLNDEEKKWLDQFNAEYVNTSMDRKHLKNNIVARTKKEKKAIDNRNYLRKKDVYTQEKAAGTLRFLGEYKGPGGIIENYEDNLINMLDNMEKLPNKK